MPQGAENGTFHVVVGLANRPANGGQVANLPRANEARAELPLSVAGFLAFHGND